MSTSKINASCLLPHCVACVLGPDQSMCNGKHNLQDQSNNAAMLEEARKLTSSREILLWMTPSEAPMALQASACSELLDPMRASCWIFAQH